MAILSGLNNFRISVAEWLSTPISQNTNYWSLVHLLSGVVIVWVLIKYKIWERLGKFAWVLLVLGLIAYEIFEITIGMPLFRIETRADIILDVIIGLIGGFLAWRLLR